MANSSIDAITANDVYRALSPAMAKQLHDFCKIGKENPAAVIADALAMHFDEFDGATFDPALAAPEALAGAAP